MTGRISVCLLLTPIKQSLPASETRSFLLWPGKGQCQSSPIKPKRRNLTWWVPALSFKKCRCGANYYFKFEEFYLHIWPGPYVICVCSCVCPLGVTSSAQSAVGAEDRMPDIPRILHTGSRSCLWTQPRTSSEWKSTGSAQTQRGERGSGGGLIAVVLLAIATISDPFLRLGANKSLLHATN